MSDYLAQGHPATQQPSKGSDEGASSCRGGGRRSVQGMQGMQEVQGGLGGGRRLALRSHDLGHVRRQARQRGEGVALRCYSLLCSPRLLGRSGDTAPAAIWTPPRAGTSLSPRAARAFPSCPLPPPCPLPSPSPCPIRRCPFLLSHSLFNNFCLECTKHNFNANF